MDKTETEKKKKEKKGKQKIKKKKKIIKKKKKKGGGGDRKSLSNTCGEENEAKQVGQRGHHEIAKPL